MIWAICQITLWTIYTVTIISTKPEPYSTDLIPNCTLKRKLPNSKTNIEKFVVKTRCLEVDVKMQKN